jgi:hypothetical protein
MYGGSDCQRIHFGVFYCMPNEDIEKQLSDYATEIRTLKGDVRELLDLVRLLASFVQYPASGTEEEKMAIEFESRLEGALEKHARYQHSMKGKDGMEGQILIAQSESNKEQSR